MLYHASDIRPKPCCRTYAQEKDPHFVLSVIEKVRYAQCCPFPIRTQSLVFPFSCIAYLEFFRLVGGRAQSTANLVEGLACCLQFFDDIKGIRENGQKYCVLICNSPPNMMPVMENDQYAGNHLDQLASLFGEVSIFFVSLTR